MIKSSSGPSRLCAIGYPRGALARTRRSASAFDQAYAPRFSISGHLIRDTVVAMGGPEPQCFASPVVAR